MGGNSAAILQDEYTLALPHDDQAIAVGHAWNGQETDSAEQGGRDAQAHQDGGQGAAQTAAGREIVVDGILFAAALDAEKDGAGQVDKDDQEVDGMHGRGEGGAELRGNLPKSELSLFLMDALGGGSGDPPSEKKERKDALGGGSGDPPPEKKESQRFIDPLGRRSAQAPLLQLYTDRPAAHSFVT